MGLKDGLTSAPKKSKVLASSDPFPNKYIKQNIITFIV